MSPESPATLPDFLAERVRLYGPRPLIALGERRLHYAEAEAASGELACGLLASGVAKGNRVGVHFANGPEWVVAWLAAVRIGAVAVPINTFYTPRELGYVLRHADIHTLLTTSQILGRECLAGLEACAPSLASARGPELRVPELPFLRRVYVSGDSGGRAWAQSLAALQPLAAASGVDAELLAAVEAELSPADPAIVIYSSGSTADPKGAIHGHGALVRHTINLNRFRDLKTEDRVYSPMPFFWVGGLVFSLLSTLERGAFLICEERFEPGATLTLLEAERATIVSGWPHYSKALLEHPSFGQRDLSSIRSGNLYDVLPEAVRPKDPQLRSNSLGMTETLGPHTIDRMDVDLPERLRGSFGHAVPGLEHKIVDPESGAVLPPGQSGEICVRGYSLMQGLVKVAPEETFDAEGFYHTGDVGSFDEDGVLFFEARLGDLIKTGGANVSPREVEVELEAQAEVSSAYVVGLPDPARGQNVAAALVLAPDARLDEASLRKRLRSSLSAYKVPRHFFVCEKSELPFTDSGKIDKRRLAELLAQRGAANATS
jgi:acyl-CoA synthetase (AMP-forming)/AMP-acid ligase II